jgi:hypothetical protein
MSNTRTRDDERDEVTAHQEELRDELREARKEVARIEREIVAESTPVTGGQAIIPELDLEGGTVYRVGDETYETMEDAQEAAAPAEVEARDDATSRVKRARGASDDE